MAHLLEVLYAFCIVMKIEDEHTMRSNDRCELALYFH